MYASYANKFPSVSFNQDGLFKQAWIYNEAAEIQIPCKINK